MRGDGHMEDILSLGRVEGDHESEQSMVGERRRAKTPDHEKRSPWAGRRLIRPIGCWKEMGKIAF